MKINHEKEKQKTTREEKRWEGKRAWLIKMNNETIEMEEDTNEGLLWKGCWGGKGGGGILQSKEEEANRQEHTHIQYTLNQTQKSSCLQFAKKTR